MDSGDEGSALVAKHRPGTRKKPGEKPTCYECGKEGHIRRECPEYTGIRFHKANYTCGSESGDSDGGRSTSGLFKAGRRQKGVKYPSNRPQCFNCNGLGHIARFCPKEKYGHSEKGGDTKDRSWILDTGAGANMTWSKGSIRNYKEFKRPKRVRIGNGQYIPAYGSGEVPIRVKEGSAITLRDVWFVPGAVANFVSTRVQSNSGYRFEFGSTDCLVRRKGKIVAMGDAYQDTYKLRC